MHAYRCTAESILRKRGYKQRKFIKCYSVLRQYQCAHVTLPCYSHKFQWQIPVAQSYYKLQWQIPAANSSRKSQWQFPVAKSSGKFQWQIPVANSRGKIQWQNPTANYNDNNKEDINTYTKTLILHASTFHQNFLSTVPSSSETAFSSPD